ncbi:MAG TPA: 4Fe-4S single cluster domain-containing protein [Methanospirillum sp.]|nr:4Fe-4S single cluster domain-containing protein [Methanospirillum sp.]
MSGLLVHHLFFPVEVLGPGRRVGIWFQGCSIRCRGCIAPETWEFDQSRYLPFTTLKKNLEFFLSNTPSGVTISGGEPFDQADGLLSLLTLIRETGYTDIMVYSGYQYEHLVQKYPDHFPYIDLLISDPFEQEQANTRLWCGSDNQRIHVFSPERYDEVILNNQVFPEERNIQVELIDDRIMVIGIPKRETVRAIQKRNL